VSRYVDYTNTESNTKLEDRKEKINEGIEEE